ncbi:MAG: hypothetical protein QOG35_1123, partial [Solirubrobacteraceae bacterium]|nr:hypothetical protein [Solirubrobacteraceae bacterium]
MDHRLHRGRVALAIAVSGVLLCAAFASQASAAPLAHGDVV